MTPPDIERRSPALVLVFSIITFGVYLPFWYHGIYKDLVMLTGKTPTGKGFWTDFLFVIITFGIYGIWVDYQISIQIRDYELRQRLEPVEDTSVVAVILDAAAYFTGFLTNFVTSAIQQDQLNRLYDRIEARLPSSTAVPA